MSTASDLIKGSLRLVGAIASGETPSADETADALSSLNRMLGSWSNEGLAVYSYVREVFTLIASQGKYTMGSAGDFNTTRPVAIAEASASDASPVYEYKVQILNVQEWAEITNKTIQATYVQKIYVEGTYPLENINVWPVPNVASSLILYSHKELTSFALAGDTVSLPPGYEEALIYNLAVRLAPEYGKTLGPEIISIASESKANIKRTNTKPVLMKSDAFGLYGRASRRGYNILIGK